MGTVVPGLPNEGMFNPFMIHHGFQKVNVPPLLPVRLTGPLAAGVPAPDWWPG